MSIKNEKEERKVLEEKESKGEKKDKVQVGGYFGSLFKWNIIIMMI